jgi:hypothetical protein
MKKKIHPISASVVNLGIKIIEKTLIEKIPIETIKSDVKLILEPITKMVKVLSDKDPNDKVQIETVWLKFVRSNEFNQAYKARVIQLVNLIEDDFARDFIRSIVNPCLETIQALYDENPNNVEQIRDIWISFITNDSNIDSILNFIFVDEIARDSVRLIIESVKETIFSL